MPKRLSSTIGNTLLLLLLAFSSEGCGGGEGLPDAAFDAATLVDGGTVDSGVVEVDGGQDAAAPDGGLADASATDAGPPPATCTDCHGDETGIAPPVDTEGNTATTFIGVGAHRSHLGVDSPWHRDVECTDCHVVPMSVDDIGHVDTGLPAELSWGALATSDGATPSFDRATTTCNGVYCHGETLVGGGGANTTPNWTRVAAGEATCGSCHSIPPGPPHPADANCATCHPTIGASFTFTQPQRHIDGVVDLLPGGLSCTTCHGSGASPAPPQDTSGNVDTTARGVGAHRSHLGSSSWHNEVTCDMCHVVPSAVTDPGHNDTALPAELTFGALALTDGAAPSFDGATTTCSGVYCHGATLLPGGANTTPSWTRVGMGEAACGTCHGLPPAAPHPSATDCATCHPTVASDLTFVEPDRHIDGVVDVVALDCTSCHGDPATGEPAPPRDTSGGTATTRRGVGAHASHLASSTWRAPIGCTECHVRPASVSDPGHNDSALPAELVWGARATADGATPSFDGSTLTCSGVYCHGETLLPGGTNTTPEWTSVGAGEAACGSCHGLPPGGTHTSLSTCQSCHGAVIDASGTIIAPDLHVDGVVEVATYHPAGWSASNRHGSTANDTGLTACQGCHGAALDGGAAGVSCESCHSGWQTDCTFCHGGLLDATGAPPEGIDGEVTRTLLAVGAHSEHVSTTSMHVAWTCDQCHVTPTSALSAGHIDGDGRAELTFGPLNPAASYDPATGTCASLYCHGNGSSTVGTMVWSTDPTLDCGSCHADFFAPTQAALQAMSGGHDRHVRRRGLSCDDCHSANVDASGNILMLARHVDGVVDNSVSGFDPTLCGGGGGCNPMCHGNRCW